MKFAHCGSPTAPPKAAEDCRSRAPSSSTTPPGGRPGTTETMKEVDNSSETASPRGGVGSNVMRIQSTATQVNTIRRARMTSLRLKGEVEPQERACGIIPRPRHGGQGIAVRVVGRKRSFENLGLLSLKQAWEELMSLTKEQNADRRAVCGRAARPVRREGRRKPMRRPYPYHMSPEP